MLIWLMNTSVSESEEFVFAETSAMAGTITFSTKSIEKRLHDETESGYGIENEYLALWCKKGTNNKENHLFWLLLHEFVHLLQGTLLLRSLLFILPRIAFSLICTGYTHDRHDAPFFEQVARFAEENDFLFEV